MRFLRAALPVVAFAGLFVASERPAHALGPIDLEAGAKVGFSTNPNGDLPYNPLGFGLGARAGVGIYHFYGGLSFVHYFGGSSDLNLLPGQSTEVKTSTNLLGAEIGYTITALPLLDIRPQLGIGSAVFNASSGGNDSSDSHLYLEPGVTVLVPLGLLYVGGDANVLLIPSVDSGIDKKTYTSFTIHGQIGLRI